MLLSRTQTINFSELVEVGAGSPHPSMSAADGGGHQRTPAARSRARRVRPEVHAEDAKESRQMCALRVARALIFTRASFRVTPRLFATSFWFVSVGFHTRSRTAVLGAHAAPARRRSRAGISPPKQSPALASSTLAATRKSSARPSCADSSFAPRSLCSRRGARRVRARTPPRERAQATSARGGARRRSRRFCSRARSGTSESRAAVARAATAAAVAAWLSGRGPGAR